jgi:hypothetical protein
MKFPRKVIVAVDLTEHMAEEFSPLHRMDFLAEAEIHLVHCSKIVSYNFSLGLGALIYPLQDERTLIEQAVLTKIASSQTKILPYAFSGRLVVKCLFGEKPAAAFCAYAKENLGDLLIIAPKKSRGIFEGSFASFVTGHADGNILLLKPS